MRVFAVLILFLSCNYVFSQPVLAWQKCFGGTGSEKLTDFILTSDGGYVFAASAHSNDGDVWGLNGNVVNNNGNLEDSDYWVVKVSSANEIQWQTCLGGNDDESPQQIIQTSDGGFVVGGYSQSQPGPNGQSNNDVAGNHGGRDIWVVKLNVNGIIEWQRCYGGSPITDFYDGNEYLTSISQTSDGGFILVGTTESLNLFKGDPNAFNGDVSGNHGQSDIWVVKISANGTVEWQRCLGGSSSEFPYSLTQTSDGGFISVGNTRSFDGDVIGQHSSGLSSSDIWVVKLDSNGIIEWQRCLGGTYNETMIDNNVSMGIAGVPSFTETSDFGFVLTGTTASNNDGDVDGYHGNYDIWVVKLDMNGNIEWQRCFGGSAYDSGTSIVQTIDGGFLGCGGTTSSDGDVTGYHMGWNGLDIWVFKLDQDGNLEWQKCLGGSGGELPSLARQTMDGNYVVAGMTSGGYYIEGSPFSNDGDIMGFHAGYDFWIVGLNENGQLQWQNCLGGSSYEGAWGANQTFEADGCTFKLADNGDIIFAGSTASNDGDVSGNHSDSFDIWVGSLSNDVTSSVEDFTQNEIIAYPNPTNDILYIKVAKVYNGEPFFIYDMFGKCVCQGKLSALQNSISVDGIAAGVYRLTTQGRSLSIVKN